MQGCSRHARMEPTGPRPCSTGKHHDRPSLGSRAELAAPGNPRSNSARFRIRGGNIHCCEWRRTRSSAPEADFETKKIEWSWPSAELARSAAIRSPTHRRRQRIGRLPCRQRRHADAQAAGIVICLGVRFDVTPTDCMAAVLKTQPALSSRLTRCGARRVRWNLERTHRNWRRSLRPGTSLPSCDYERKSRERRRYPGRGARTSRIERRCQRDAVGRRSMGQLLRSSQQEFGQRCVAWPRHARLLPGHLAGATA